MLSLALLALLDSTPFALILTTVRFQTTHPTLHQDIHSDDEEGFLFLVPLLRSDDRLAPERGPGPAFSGTGAAATAAGSAGTEVTSTAGLAGLDSTLAFFIVGCQE